MGHGICLEEWLPIFTCHAFYNGSSSSFEIRDMKIDRLQQASENSMVVHLFVDGRYGSYSTNRLDKKELEKFIKDGISATRFLAEDKARTLPDASLYYKGGAADLRLVDPNFDSVQPDDKVALAMSVCEESWAKTTGSSPPTLPTATRRTLSTW